jgi:hypothetical protein
VERTRNGVRSARGLRPKIGRFNRDVATAPRCRRLSFQALRTPN